VIASLTKAGTSELISVLIATLFSALANTFVYVQVIGDTGCALVSRFTLLAASNSACTSLAHTLIQVVAIFTTSAATCLTVLLQTIGKESALLALAIANKVAF